MADNVAVTAGSGTTIAADEVSDGTLGSCKVQYVKLMDGTLDGTAKALVDSSGLAVKATQTGTWTVQAGTAATGITPVVSGSLEGSHVIKSGAGTLFGWHATITTATSGYVMIFDATSAPADGGVTPKICIAVGAGQTVGADTYGGPPITFSTGITIVFSSTGPFTKTVSATAFFSAQAV